MTGQSIRVGFLEAEGTEDQSELPWIKAYSAPTVLSTFGPLTPKSSRPLGERRHDYPGRWRSQGSQRCSPLFRVMQQQSRDLNPGSMLLTTWLCHPLPAQPTAGILFSVSASTSNQVLILLLESLTLSHLQNQALVQALG